MLERTQIFVDTSYLLASFYNSWETGARAQLEIDLPEVVATLGSMVEAHLKQPVHRQMWYDGIPDSGPHRYQRALRTCDGVQLRAGQLIEWGERRTQKGVDTRLVADMVLAAVRRDFTDLVLVSGDADMIPGVQEAVEAGVRVHLYAFGWESMSSALRHCCDSTTILDPREDFADCMQLEILEGPLPPVVRTPVDSDDAATSQDASTTDVSKEAGNSTESTEDLASATDSSTPAAPATEEHASENTAPGADENPTEQPQPTPGVLAAHTAENTPENTAENKEESSTLTTPTEVVESTPADLAGQPRSMRPGEPPLSQEDTEAENMTHGARYSDASLLRQERFGREQARRSTSNSVTEERDGSAHRITVTSTVEESVELTLPHFQGNYPSSSVFQRPANQGLEQEMAEEDEKEAQQASRTAPKPSDMRPTAPRPTPNPSMMAGRRKLRSRYVPLPSEVWATAGNQTPYDVGQQYALWWYENAATDAQRDSSHLLSGGGLPPEIDRPLLQFACETLHEYTLTESQRVALRDGFHSGIRGILVNNSRN